MDEHPDNAPTVPTPSPIAREINLRLVKSGECKPQEQGANETCGRWLFMASPFLVGGEIPTHWALEQCTAAQITYVPIRLQKVRFC